MDLTTDTLTDLLDEIDPLTVHDCGRIIAAATAVRAFGPMPDLEPPEWWKDEWTADAERAAAERDFRVGQRAHAGMPDLPMNWDIDYHLDGCAVLCFRAINFMRIIDPEITPEGLLAGICADLAGHLAASAADWQAQAADLISRADLAERLAVAMICAT